MKTPSTQELNAILLEARTMRNEAMAQFFVAIGHRIARLFHTARPTTAN